MRDEDFLPGLPVERIRASYAAAPGQELASGKFANAESSAALVANAFGLFLERPALLPQIPGGVGWSWPARSLALEATVRFPWSGGRHPCLDVLVVTDSALIGIESKRYEPFRTKPAAGLSDAYWRPVWGANMTGFERMRDGLRNHRIRFEHLDAAQLVKHAFGLRSAIDRDGEGRRKRPELLCWGPLSSSSSLC
jgi:hypothetical protein